MEPPPLPREDEHDAEHDSSEAGALAGRWTREEHDLFLKGLELHGREWKKIAASIKTRTVVQIRTHAQKYFQRLSKESSHSSHAHRDESDDSEHQERSVKKQKPLSKIRAPSIDEKASGAAGGITPRTVAAATILLAPRHQGDSAQYLLSQANAAAILRRTSPRFKSGTSSPAPAWDGI